MFLHNITCKTAQQLVDRLREVEKLRLRAVSTPAELEHLRQTEFASDAVSEEVMQQAKELLMKNFVEVSAQPGFGKTWTV